MKRPVYILLVLSFFCNKELLLAQQNKFELGLLGGPNRVKLVGNQFVETFYKSIYLYSAGVSLQYNFPKLFSIQSGLLYERKGGGDRNISVTDEMGRKIGTASYTMNFDYLVMPLLAKASFGKKTKFFLSAGAYLAYCQMAKLNYNSTVIDGYSRDLSSQYKKQDAGLMIGGGVAIPIFSKLSLSAELRYSQGLHDISTDQVFKGEKVQTLSANLLIGIHYKFGLRKK